MLACTYVTGCFRSTVVRRQPGLIFRPRSDFSAPASSLFSLYRHETLEHMFLVNLERPSAWRFHMEKTLVVYHKVTDFFPCGICEFSKISHWNACGMVRASAVTWHNPIPAKMFLQAGLGRTSTSSANLPSAGIGFCHVTADARARTHPTSISVGDFRKFTNPTRKKICGLITVVYHRSLFHVGNATRWSNFPDFPFRIFPSWDARALLSLVNLGTTRKS